MVIQWLTRLVPQITPLTPIDDDDDHEDDLTDAEIDEISCGLMKGWLIAEPDLLRENEVILLNHPNPNAAAIKIADDAKWTGYCEKCNLTWAPPLPLSVRQQIDIQCPECGNKEAYWRIDKKEVIGSAALRTRVSEGIAREIEEEDLGILPQQTSLKSDKEGEN
jgi:RNase P subunit RPR2